MPYNIVNGPEGDYQLKQNESMQLAREVKLRDMATLRIIAWYAYNSGQWRLDSGELEDNGNDTHPVGGKASNDFGLYDMLGNVSEYCNDWYDEKYYEVSVKMDPVETSNGEFRVIRGGDYRIRPLGVRVSWRSYMLLDHRFKSIGFRCVLDAIPQWSIVLQLCLVYLAGMPNIVKKIYETLSDA